MTWSKQEREHQTWEKKGRAHETERARQSCWKMGAMRLPSLRQKLATRDDMNVEVALEPLRVAGPRVSVGRRPLSHNPKYFQLRFGEGRTPVSQSEPWQILIHDQSSSGRRVSSPKDGILRETLRSAGRGQRAEGRGQMQTRDRRRTTPAVAAPSTPLAAAAGAWWPYLRRGDSDDDADDDRRTLLLGSYAIAEKDLGFNQMVTLIAERP